MVRRPLQHIAPPSKDFTRSGFLPKSILLHRNMVGIFFQRLECTGRVAALPYTEQKEVTIMENVMHNHWQPGSMG